MKTRPGAPGKGSRLDSPEDGTAPKGRILVDLGSAIIAHAVAGLVESYGYRCYTKDAPNCDLDVVIVDSSTIDKKTAERYPKSKVVLLETDAHERNFATSILFQKVHGIISRYTDSGKLRKALDAIAGGQFWVDNTTVKGFLTDSGLVSNKGEIPGLTPKEKIVVESVCLGDTNKEIAYKLQISIHTVKTHIRSIMRKTGAVNRSNLASMMAKFMKEGPQALMSGRSETP